MAEITVTVDAHLTIEQAKEDAYEVLKDRYWPRPLPNVELVHTDTIRNIDPPLYGANGTRLAHFVFEVYESEETEVKEIVDDSPALPNDTDTIIKERKMKVTALKSKKRLLRIEDMPIGTYFLIKYNDPTIPETNNLHLVLADDLIYAFESQRLYSFSNFNDAMVDVTDPFITDYEIIPVQISEIIVSEIPNKNFKKR